MPSHKKEDRGATLTNGHRCPERHSPSQQKTHRATPSQKTTTANRRPKRPHRVSPSKHSRGVVGILCALRVTVMGSGFFFVVVCFLQSQHPTPTAHQHSNNPQNYLGGFYHPAHPGMLQGWKLADYNTTAKARSAKLTARDHNYLRTNSNNINKINNQQQMEEKSFPVFIPGGDQSKNGNQAPLFSLKDNAASSATSIQSGHSFQPQEFQRKLTEWRQQTGRIKSPTMMGHQQQTTMVPYHEQYQQRHQQVVHQSRFLTQLQSSEQADQTPQHPQLSIPFWGQQLMYKNRNSWHLMVVLLVDDCFPHKIIANQPKNADSKAQYQQQHQYVYPSLGTLRDALQTNHADIIVYLPQMPQSTLFPEASRMAQQEHQMCQSKLTAAVQSQYASELESGQLQIVLGIVNPLPPRIKYEYHHRVPHALEELKKNGQYNTTNTGNGEPSPPIVTNQKDDTDAATEERLRHYFQRLQLQLEVDYSLGLDLAYIAELVYQYGDLLFLLQSGTRLAPKYRRRRHSAPTAPSASARNGTGANATGDDVPMKPLDYGLVIVEQYERYQNRRQDDLVVRRFCYLSFLEQDLWLELPKPRTRPENLPPRYQSKLMFPTSILMERHGLYRFSMFLRSLLPYHKDTTSGLMMLYCTEFLWESQILQPVGPDADLNNTEPADWPPPLWTDETESVLNYIVRDREVDIPEVNPALVQQVEHEQQRQQQISSHLTVPPWVTVDGSQLGPQRDDSFDHAIAAPPRTAITNYTKARVGPKRNRITFVVPTATRPNGIKNQYVTFSLNQLLPLIRRDFKSPEGVLEASILLVICGNTQAELDDHEAGLWEYYGPEIKEGIVEIVSTNLDTYPSLHNLADNYGDDENRLRWRSKQNLDVSSSFFAAKGKSDYVMMLEDDTGYREKFTTVLKGIMDADQKREDALVPDPAISKAVTAPPNDDFREHIFSQIHFGFGYSGLLVHDDDVLVYAVLHFIMMDEKPCDLLYVTNYLQGATMDQKYRWQLKKVLITHLGSVSSLKGKIQPVWGVKG